MLVAEVRAARVISCHPPDRRPAHLPSGCDAVKASLRSVSGGRVSVILGGPPEGDTDSASSSARLLTAFKSCLLLSTRPACTRLQTFRC